MKGVYIALLILVCCSLSAQYDHLSITPELEGEALRFSLIDNYQPQTVLSLREARDTLYAKVHLHRDSVRCVYTTHAKFLTPGADPSTDLFGAGGSTDLNLEHGFPQAKGADFGPPNSDMHHLFPSRVLVNSARGNDPMVELPDNEVVRWFYKDQTRTSTPSGNRDLWSEDADVEFEPRDAFKGNIARAYFYFYTMYQSQADAADPDYFELQRETLCEWHNLDPVDSLEWVRTFKIAEFQDDKPNPFVLDCRLARLYCGDIGAACRTVSTEDASSYDTQLFPNPAQPSQRLHIEVDDTILAVDFIDMYGQKVPAQRTAQGWNAPPHIGTYTLLIQTTKGTIAQKLVVL